MSKKKLHSGFTLVELLVVISIIALLLSVMMPALNQAKEVARALVCSAQMRVYGTAVNLYANDWDNYFPRYAALDNPPPHMDLSHIEDRPDLNWQNALATYVGGEAIDMSGTDAERQVTSDENMTADFRKCPSGKKDSGATTGNWTCWVGVNYGSHGGPKSRVPWVWRKLNDPGFKMYDIRNPASCISFLDTSAGGIIYSPAIWGFDADLDGDGKFDSNAGTTQPYNLGKPKIHNNKCNTVRADGHVEKLTFEKFLKSGRNEKHNKIWRFR